MRNASPATVRWFLALSVIYGCVCYALRSRIPPRFLCNAEDLFLASIFALICILCVLVGAAGFSSIERSEHPVSFWTIVAVGAFLSVFFAVAGLGLTAPACVK